MTYQRFGNLLHGLLIAYVPMSFLLPLAMYELRDNNRLILMDQAHSYHITEYSSAETLRKLYEYQMKQAVFAFLMRNPTGFDNKELLDLMFQGQAKLEAHKQLAAEADQFRTYKMHQKPEILNIRILRADRRRSYAKIEGQLIRYYVGSDLQQRTFTVDFELNMELQVNFDTATNSRYPFHITNLKYTQNEQKEK
jgi:hypothetical protein